MSNQFAKYAVVSSVAAVGFALVAWTRHEPIESAKFPKFQAHGCQQGYESNLSVTPTSEALTSHYAPNDYDAPSDFVENQLTEIRGRITSTYSVPEAPEIVDMLPAIAEPLQIAELSTPTDGVLWKLHIREGEQVDEGNLLALIDNRVTVASYRVAEAGASRKATLEIANAKLTLAQQFLKRIESAHGQNAASGLELDEARSRVEEARATLEEGRELQREADARLALERARLDGHELLAPFSGTVTRIKKNVGETLTRDTTLMTLANLSRLRAELHVPTTYMNQYRCGSEAQLIATLPDQPRLIGRVVHVDPILDAATSTMRIVVEIDNRQLQLPAGFGIQLVAPDPTVNDATL